jgi:hypothetical protein
MSKSSLLDGGGQGGDIWDNAFMESLISAKPKKITKNNSINLKKMSVYFWNAKIGVREGNAFDPIRET